jgi:hypothetical protein
VIEDEAVFQKPKRIDAEHGAEDRPLAAKQAGAAKDDGGDGLQFQTRPGGGIAGLEAHGDDDPAQRRGEA